MVVMLVVTYKGEEIQTEMTTLVFTRGGGGRGGGGWKHPQAIFLPLGVGPLLHFNVAQAGQQTTDQGVGTGPAPLQNSGDRGLTLSEI
jgi:hypothetical protein